MSESASVAIIDAIISELTSGARAVTAPVALDRRTIGFEPGGSPPPKTGQFYIAVDEEGIVSSAETMQHELEEIFRISITISYRIGQVAADQRDKIYRAHTYKLEQLERQILNCVHGQQSIRTAANANRVANDAEFLTPLASEGRTKTDQRGAEWSGEVSGNAAGWLVRKMTFRGMKRIVFLGSIL